MDQSQKIFQGFKGYNLLKKSELELIDRAVLYYGIYEINSKELPKEIIIDECIRLSKKFSSPDSYKFINVYLDKYLKIK